MDLDAFALSNADDEEEEEEPFTSYDRSKSVT
jgi:hypothetical protein